MMFQDKTEMNCCALEAQGEQLPRLFLFTSSRCEVNDGVSKPQRCGSLSPSLQSFNF